MLICLQSANLAHQIKTQTKYDALLQVEDPDTAYTSLLTFNVIPYHHSISLFPLVVLGSLYCLQIQPSEIGRAD